MNCYGHCDNFMRVNVGRQWMRWKISQTWKNEGKKQQSVEKSGYNDRWTHWKCRLDPEISVVNKFIPMCMQWIHNFEATAAMMLHTARCRNLFLKTNKSSWLDRTEVSMHNVDTYCTNSHCDYNPFVYVVTAGKLNIKIQSCSLSFSYSILLWIIYGRHLSHFRRIYTTRAHYYNCGIN